jgi:hypothetical protein
MRVILAIVDEQIHLHELTKTDCPAEAHKTLINHYHRVYGPKVLIRQQVVEVEALPAEV